MNTVKKETHVGRWRERAVGRNANLSKGVVTRHYTV